MKEYISKSALVVEIEKRKAELQSRIVELGTFESNTLGLFQEVDLYDDIISFLDTLETKEVDLEKELDKYTVDNFWALEGNNESPYLLEKDDMLKVAKHFFELGLNAQKGE